MSVCVINGTPGCEQFYNRRFFQHLLSTDFLWPQSRNFISEHYHNMPVIIIITYIIYTLIRIILFSERL